MFKSIIKRVNVYVNFGDIRSVKTKKNIIGNALSKGVSIIVSLSLIPMTINYVNPATYGIWLTISSIIVWMSFFDVGIGNGLRNKLTEALANKKYLEARELISTAYLYLTIIFFTLMVGLLFINSIIDWNELLNLKGENSERINIVMIIVIIYFCVNSILSIINVVLLADQRSAEASYRALIIQLLSFGSIFILTKTTEGSLLYLAIALCIVPLVIQLLYNIILFRFRYKNFAPSASHINLKLGKDILSLGFKFFVIQIAGIVLFQSANFIIIRFYGPQEVTSYNIAFKYFSILPMMMAIFLSPFWSAVTDAYAIKDFNWINRIVNKYIIIGVCFSFIGLLMLIFSNYIYTLWVGDKVIISFNLSLFIYISTIVSIFGGIYVSVLNGAGRLQYQFKASFVSPLIFITLSYFLIKIMGIGIHAVVIAFIIANFNAYVLAPWEYYKFIKHKQS